MRKRATVPWVGPANGSPVPFPGKVLRNVTRPSGCGWPFPPSRELPGRTVNSGRDSSFTPGDELKPSVTWTTRLRSNARSLAHREERDGPLLNRETGSLPGEDRLSGHGLGSPSPETIAVHALTCWLPVTGTRTRHRPPLFFALASITTEKNPASPLSPLDGLLKSR